MNVYSSDQIRNIVILGHGGCGKTNLVDAMAFVTGAINRQGRVEEGNTISDFDKEEMKRKISIGTSIIPVEWEGCKINVLDTPGCFDFAGEVKEAIRVADGAIIVISGKSGVEVGTEKAWEYVEEMNIPKMFFVTDMDDEQANLYDVIDSLKELYGKRIAPFHIPIRDEGKFVGFVNVTKMEGRKFVKDHVETCPIPNDLIDEIEPIREMILEAVAETSDELMEKYFAQEEFTLEEIQSALHKGVVDGEIVPILCGSGMNNTGVQVLLSSIVKYMPYPKEEHPFVIGKNPETLEEIEVICGEEQPLSAFIFKTIVDPYIGKLSLFRVYSGVFKSDSMVYNANKDIDEKVSHLFCLRGKEQIEVKQLVPGDIGAVKLSNSSTGNTLCDKKNPVLLEAINYPESLAVMAIVPKTKGDEEKISVGLQKLMEEDPTIKVVMDPENHQELLYGTGDQHLDVIVSKLSSKFKVEVDLVKPRVAYRETIKGKVKVQGKHKKQSGGHGQYGDVHIEFEPSGDLEHPYIFEEKVFGGSVPKNYFPAVEKGLQESVQRGVLAGYPVVGVKATLVDGSYHPVDSSEMAFKIATTVAFKKGFQEAKPVLLEPIASVKILVPDVYMGDIIGDLNKRRGRVLGMLPMNGKQEIQGEVPMAEMFGYSTDLRSMTQGRGTFTMKFERYEQAPSDVQEKVIEESKKEA
ncbi:translation elongation factor 2 (EF-2/EF-G) [Natranaerovirga pectinivora]|uniref:Elongation factor G n=1 Tax=Natranaerovirga pectinivora TaxID=682400 RepID=A0A4R3MMU0_9FIRM|nr:elongation factor G [Natranaerovirga pectinivora]TCT15344.1 translation elongation factor 2 (EF-2/EF-G) [Natranaerovirga pectinivora]